MVGSAVSPPFRAEPHLVHRSSDAAVWFTEPPGFVLQFRRELHLDVSVAEFFTGPVHSRLKRVCPLAPGGYVWVADYAVMRSYDSKARKMLTDWLVENRRVLAHAIAIPPASGNRIGTMGIQVAAAAVRVTGIDFQIIDTVQEAVSRYGLQALPGIRTAYV